MFNCPAFVAADEVLIIKSLTHKEINAVIKVKGYIITFFFRPAEHVVQFTICLLNHTNVKHE